MRASIVVDVHAANIRKIAQNNDLSYADKERVNMIEQLITNLHNVKIADASILLKLFNLYRM
jgi:phosphopantetheine adenylyltransferase